MKLYGTTGAGSVAPQAALTHIGADFELKMLDFKKEEHLAPEFLALNPRGQIPALVLDDGTVITESAAVLLHIADMHADSGLIAAPGTTTRAQTYRWMALLATNVYEGMLRYMYPEQYTTEEKHDGVVASGEQVLSRAFAILNDTLDGRPTLVENFSVADIYMAMLFYWHHDLPALTAGLPHLQPAVDNTLSKPGISDVFSQNGLI